MRRCLASTAFAIAIAFHVPATVRADGLNANVLQPAPVGRGTVAIPATETLAPWDVDGSLVLGFAKNPLELSDPDGERVDGIVDELTTLHLRLDVGLPERIEAALYMPLTLHAGFGAEYETDRSSAAAGDLGVALRWNAIARQGTSGFGFDLGVDVSFPTGSADSLSGSDSMVFTPQLVADYALDRLRIAALGGVRLRSTDARFEYATVSHQIAYGGSAELAFGAGGEFAASGEVIGSIETSGDTGPAEALFALRYSTDSLGLMLGAGAGLSDGVGAPDYRLLAGVALRLLRTRDADNDRVLDDRDRCPIQPEDSDGFEDADGCPDPDNDGDGVSDAADRCATVAEDHDGVEDADGCPDGDNDRDGVVDANDRCVAQPEDGDGFEDTDGCPDPDNDGDGVADAADRCPMQPESANGFQDQDGCPDEAPRYIFRAHERLVFNNIEFKTKSDELLPSSLPVLDEVVASLRAQPDVRVRIEGHTDDRGDADANLTLSQRRALSVMNYLTSAGIDGRRVEYTGFGETRPIEDNQTEGGRAKNRRVEFLTLGE
jgi:outer membrane protein OmpA-like peptidoglycan-associated protein